MKGFIKILVKNDKYLYLNTGNIVLFKQGMNNNTEILVTDKVNSPTTFVTTSTPEEVADMINLANS